MTENVDITTITYILSIAGSLIIILLTVIGYLLKQFYISVKDLKVVVDQLKLVISVEQEKGKHIAESIAAIKEIAESRLNSLTNRVDIIEKDIVAMKVTDTILHNIRTNNE